MGPLDWLFHMYGNGQQRRGSVGPLGRMFGGQSVGGDMQMAPPPSGADGMPGRATVGNVDAGTQALFGSSGPPPGGAMQTGAGPVSHNMRRR